MSSPAFMKISRPGNVPVLAAVMNRPWSIKRSARRSARPVHLRVPLLDLIAQRPFVAELFGFFERELEHLGCRQAFGVEFGGFFLRPPPE